MNLCTENISYSISSEKRNVHQLNLGYKVIDFTFCQLLSFRKKILEFTSPESLITILNTDNFILLFVADNKHLIYLDVPQLLQLKEVVLSLFEAKTVTV